MINIPPIKPGTELKTERLPDITQIWKAGQVLNATVETGSETMDRILLRIGSRTFEARTPIPLKTGEQIKLLVKTLGETPLLSIQTRVDPTAVAADKLRSFLTPSINPEKLVDSIQHIISRGTLSPPLKQQLQQFIQQLPDINDILQPRQLSRLMSNSGVFLEPRLLTTPEQTTADIKGQLLRLAQTLQQELPDPPARIADNKSIQQTVNEFIRGDTTIQQLVRSLVSLLPRENMQQLLQFISGHKQIAVSEELLPLYNQLAVNIRQQPRAQAITETLVRLLESTQALQELKASVEQHLSRITSQQLIPLTRDADNPLLLLLGLVFRDKEHTYLVDFRIEQEQKARDKQQEKWSVILNFNFPELGAIQSQLHLIGDQLATSFHATQMTTVRKIEQHLPLLQSALEKIGLQVVHLDVTQQTLKQPRDIPTDIHILNEKA
ncbi:MAG: flagellar hook-length control protein FliK [Gammaproteobacteria bacterium]|nr:MAG: flagellar hook-length control protein FliK [Gammaproteobacteria bacterium]